jgi:hypothetical protein
MTDLEQAKTTLTHQTIDENNPGTILKDFNTFLQLIKDEGIEVSGKNSLFPLKLLPELNALLISPIRIDLKRPVQKSYPPLNGIYLLLRTTGLAVVVPENKKQKLALDEATYESWQQLNLTEQYFTLLETWLIHASPETIAEKHHNNNLMTCINFWQTTKDTEGDLGFNYIPGFYNLALFDLFGLLKVEEGKPEKGKGWRVIGFEKTAYGKAIFALLVSYFFGTGSRFGLSELFENLLQEELIPKFGKLQDILQPYFPEWKNNLIIHQEQSSEGVYIFKASLESAWRRIAIPSFLLLDDLAEAILNAFEFDNDHLYAFICKQRIGKTLYIKHSFMDDPPYTDEFSVGDLPLKEGQTMIFLFDLGDNWEFKLVLEEIQAPNRDLNKPTLLKSSGKPPEQYPEYEDDFF